MAFTADEVGSSTQAREPVRAGRGVIQRETILRLTLGTMLTLSCVSFIEPSPYEIFFFLLMPVAVFTGLTITRTTLVLFALVIINVTGEFIALTPYFEHRVMDDTLTPATYTMYSTYMWTSALLFAMIFSRHTRARLDLALKAYAFSCVFAGVWGILSYLDVAGIGAREPIVGRIAGPFKDPNVLGSYCVMGAVYFMQAVVIGPSRWRLVNIVGLLVTLVGGVFLSFSRGSWGATLFSTVLLIVSSYLTADRALRRRIVGSLMILGVCATVGVGIVMSNDTLRSTVTERGKLEQEYDGGYTGRFGNQKRSIPMLLERPLGFGPHRFQLTFDLDPHNSYIGSFASAGWIGGFSFLAIVASTTFIAIRAMFAASVFRRQAQVVGPALISLFIQALQIDVDHWRFVFLMLGAIWGLESARVQAADSARRLWRSRRPPPPVGLNEA